MGIDYQRMMDNPEDFVDYLDSKFDSLVQGLIEDAGKEYSYSVEDLDQMVNESETLREYIRDSEQTFIVLYDIPLSLHSYRFPHE